MFGGPEVWAKLAADPRTKGMLADPTIVAKVKALQSGGPEAMASMFQDPQMMTIISVLLGINMQGRPGGDQPMPDAPASAPARSPSAAAAAAGSKDVFVTSVRCLHMWCR